MIVKIGICEDDVDFSYHLKSELIKIPGCSVVGIAKNRAEVDILLDHKDIDLFFLDLGFPDVSGVDIAREIKKLHSDAKIIVVTAFSGRRSIMQCLELGVNGYLFKDEVFDNLPKNIIDVMRNGSPISPEVAAVLINDIVKDRAQNLHNKHHKVAAAMEVGLSQKEFAVLKLIGDGCPPHIIADNLSISPHTVNKHLQAIYRKFDVNSKLAAIKHARQLGLIE